MLGFETYREFPLVRRLPSGVRKFAKRMLAKLPSSRRIKIIAHSGDLRKWRKRHLVDEVPCFADRHALYDHLIRTQLPESFVYLEFGCAAGELVRWWADRVPHPDARFYGFDTFTGMPERWTGLGWTVEPGTWSQSGRLPEADDARVTFVPGRFQDSLEGFLQDTELFERDDPLVIHIDADLYTSALYVLVTMRPALNRAVVLFDEFDCVLDEMRALDDFCRTFGLDYRVLGTAVHCEKVAIRFATT